MSRPIQAAAPGYLSLLGLQNTGRLPPDQVDTVQPIVDVLPFYLQGALQYREDGIAVSAATPGLNAFATPMRVPDGKLWLVIDGLAFVSKAAAQVLSYKISLTSGLSGIGRDRSLSDFASIGDPFNAAAATLSDVLEVIRIPHPSFMRGGEEVFVDCEWIHGAGAATVAVHLDVIELQA